MEASPIYLDHNATTPIHPAVLEAMARSLREEWGNPSSSHPYGKKAREALEAARSEVAALLSCRSDEIVFTGGGSEADNLALKGAALHHRSGGIVTCRGEHPAVLETCAFLERAGFRITLLPIDREGRVDPEAVGKAVAPDTLAVSVMHANNETGTIQPLSRIAARVRERGALFHTDAAQTVGKVPTCVGELGVDLLTIAGHKLGGPKGVGALYVRRGVELEPLIHGGSQEGGRRAGTEAIHQAVGLGTACRIARQEIESAESRMRDLRDHLHLLLLEGVPGISLNGHPTERLPNTLNVNFPGVTGSDLLGRAPGVAASTGSACHSGETRHSPVLSSMGVPPEVGRGAVRLSLGKSTTREEVESAARRLIDAHRAIAPAR